MVRHNNALNAEATAVTALLNTGYIRIYTGSSPGVTNAATGTLLAELRFAATAFGAPTNGLATANTIAAVTAGNSGTAGYCRLLKQAASDPTDVVADLTVGTSGADLNLNSLVIAVGASVSITSFTYQATA